MANYSELNKKIGLRITEDNPRRRMLRYALDPEIMTDESYKGFASFIDRQQDPISALLDIRWYVRLYWTRAFFENGNGKDIWKSFKDTFQTQVQQRLRDVQLRQIAAKLPAPFSCRGDFLHECWLVGGGEDPDSEAGSSSEIWKFLAPLVRCLPSDARITDEKIAQIAQEYSERHEVPRYYSHLVQTGDLSFFESLRAMRAGQGEKWMSRIAPLWQRRASRPSASAQWMLSINGNMLRMDLVVDDIYIPDTGHRSLTVKQAGQNISRHIASNQDKEFFTQDDLRQASIDLSASMSIRVGNTKVDEVRWLGSESSPNCFRYSEGSRHLPRVDPKSHIYTKSLVILWPPGIDSSQTLKLGERAIQGTVLGSVQVPGVSRSWQVQLFSFDSLAGNEPQPLTWNGQELLHIGSKPYLEVENLEGSIRCLEHQTAVVHFGAQVRVNLRNLPEGTAIPKWKCQNGTIDGNGKQVTVASSSLGTPVDVGCGQTRKTILCLPQGALDGSANGWEWVPSTDDEEIVRFAREGAEVGTLANVNRAIRLTRPLKRIVWWWEEGVNGKTEFQTKPKGFLNYGELTPYRLCLWVPEGQVGILRLNGHQVETFGGPNLYSTWLEQTLVGRLMFANGIGEVALDSLAIEDTVIAEILHVPSSPALTIHNNLPHVFFPDRDYDPAEYSVICCYESGLIDDSIAVISCSQYERGQLNCVALDHERRNGEGMWLLLIHSTDLPKALIGFAYGQQYHVESHMVWREPDTSQTLRDRLATNMSDDQINSVRGRLDVLACIGKSLSQRGVFSQAIAERELLAYSDRPEFWNKYFIDHCQLKQPPQGSRPRGRKPQGTNPLSEQLTPLDVTLGLMPRAGFNWCAEPMWLKWAYQEILNCRNRGLSRPRRQLADDETKLLVEICPAIPAQLAIVQGFPICDQAVYPCPDLNRALLCPPDNLISMSCPQSAIPCFSKGVCLRQVAKDGVRLQSFREFRRVCFRYHECNKVQATDGWHVFEVKVVDDLGFKGFVMDVMDEEDVAILNLEQNVRLMTAYEGALNSASGVLGPLDTRGLGYMLFLAAQGFKELSEQDPAQVNRLVIFQTAVLSRLHAWLGWNGAAYPKDWPLLNPQEYGLVCGVVREAWTRTACRKALLKDMIPVEWLLAWYHR